jgi:hypothetical protein
LPVRTSVLEQQFPLQPQLQPQVLLPGPSRTTPRVVTRELRSAMPTYPQLPPSHFQPLGSRLRPTSNPPSLPNQAPLMPMPMPAPASQGAASRALSPSGNDANARAAPASARTFGSGNGASYAMQPAVRRDSQPKPLDQQETKQPGSSGVPPPRTVPLVVRADKSAPSNLVRQSSEAPSAPVQSKLTVVSPRLATRADCLGPDAAVKPVLPLPGQREDARPGFHPARSTLHICRPSGSVNVRPIEPSGSNVRQVRPTSPGFRRDQSNRTTLPANLVHSAALSPRGLGLHPNSKIGIHQATARSLPRH